MLERKYLLQKSNFYRLWVCFTLDMLVDSSVLQGMIIMIYLHRVLWDPNKIIQV